MVSKSIHPVYKGTLSRRTIQLPANQAYTIETHLYWVVSINILFVRTSRAICSRDISGYLRWTLQRSRDPRAFPAKTILDGEFSHLQSVPEKPSVTSILYFSHNVSQLWSKSYAIVNWTPPPPYFPAEYRHGLIVDSKLSRMQSQRSIRCRPILRRSRGLIRRIAGET